MHITTRSPYRRNRHLQIGSEAGKKKGFGDLQCNRSEARYGTSVSLIYCTGKTLFHDVTALAENSCSQRLALRLLQRTEFYFQSRIVPCFPDSSITFILIQICSTYSREKRKGKKGRRKVGKERKWCCGGSTLFLRLVLWSLEGSRGFGKMCLMSCFDILFHGSILRRVCPGATFEVDTMQAADDSVKEGSPTYGNSYQKTS